MKQAKDIYILVGCEESQAVTIEFRKLGFNAFSCDLLPCSGGHPEWHIQGDVFEAIKSRKWDAGIFHPTCTYLTNSGVRWLHPNDLIVNPVRWSSLVDAMEFFNEIKSICSLGGINYLALENPIPHKYARDGFGLAKGIGKYNQLIQPWQFGDTTSKATCLWLNGFPNLIPTSIVPKEQRTFEIHKCAPGPDRAKIRSKTFPGIALAIADQWGKYLTEVL